MSLFTGPDGRYRTVTATGAARYHAETLERIRVYLAEHFVQPDEVFPKDVLRAWAADGLGLLSFNQFCKMEGITDREAFHFHVTGNRLENRTTSFSLVSWRNYYRSFCEQRDFADEKATQHDALPSSF